MTIIHNWALKHKIPYAAVADLLQQMGALGQAVEDEESPAYGASETYVQNHERVMASRAGERLWRNNVGALMDKTGRLVRYGLANDSEKSNTILKSGDLIGIKPVLITPQHVGTTIGQFKSRECKPTNWIYTGDQRESAQLAWIMLVNSLGGDARFTNGRGV